MSHQSTVWTDVISGQPSVAQIVADVPSYTFATLPVSQATGRLARVTNVYPGLYLDTGAGWVPLHSLIQQSYTKAGLPAAGVAGRLARITDDVRGLWMDQGSQWFSLSGEVVNVKEFGAKGDGVTDDTTAIINAIAAANPNGVDGVSGKGIVYFPPGTYQINSQLVIPGKVKLFGAGTRATRIRVASNFSGLSTTGAIRIGNATEDIVGVVLKDFMLEVSGYLSSVGIMSGDLQNGCIIENVLVNNWAGYGILLDGSLGFRGSVNEFDIKSVSLFKAAVGGTSGVGLSIKNGSYAGTLSYIQSTSESASHPLSKAYEVVNHNVFFEHSYSEAYGTDGFYFGATANGGCLECRVNGTYTNAFHMASTAQRIVLIHARRGNAGTNILDDGTPSVNITDTIVPIYVRGDSSYFAEQIQSLIGTGTAPFLVTSRTPVPNLRVEGLDIVATGSLPAAGSSQDGKVIIEDAGTGDRNIILYAGGQRFRIDGGASV